MIEFEFNTNTKLDAGDPSLPLRMTGPWGLILGKEVAIRWKIFNKEFNVYKSPLLSPQTTSPWCHPECQRGIYPL